MKNKRYPLWGSTLFIVAIMIGFQFNSTDAFAVWTTVRDPETDKMVTIRVGETLEEYKARNSSKIRTAS